MAFAHVSHRFTGEKRRVFIIHMLFACFEGAIFGLFKMAPVVLRRELTASPLMITIFVMLMPVSSLFSMYFSHLLSRRPDRVYRYIFLTGLFSRLPLLFMLLWHTSAAYLVIGALFYIGWGFIKPVQNIFIRENYHQNELGKMFGYSLAFSHIAFIITTWTFGKLMDMSGDLHPLIYAGGGLIAFFSSLLLLLIPFKNWKREEHNVAPFDPWLFPTLIRVFRENRRFFIFETAFFVYGGGFMITMVTLPILLVDRLNLTYSIISFGQGVVAGFVIILLTPLFGRLFDSRNPVYIGKVIFSLLGLYPLFLLLTNYVPIHARELTLYTSFLFFGIGMAGVKVIWNIGPMYFADTYRNVPLYTSVHVTMTGIRGLIMPPAGYLLLMLDIRIPLLFAAVLFFSSGIIMTILHRSCSE